MTWYDRQTPEIQRKLADYVASLPADDRIRRYGADNIGYAAWLAVADRKCGRMLGIGIFDLVDYMWRDAYDNGDSPYEALGDALAEDDLYGTLFGE